MISIELLEKVLRFESGNTFIKSIETRYSDIEYLCNFGSWIILSKYELMYKCKEWALSLGYYLTSNIYLGGGCCQILTDNAEECPECGTEISNHIVHEDTEVYAVIKACEWILKEIK